MAMANLEFERVPWGADETIGDISNGVSTTFTFTNRRRLFKPENMVISGLTASGPTVQGLTVTDIKIGTKSLLASAQSVSAQLFTDDSVIGAISWPDIGVTETIKVTIKNEGSAVVSVVQVGIIGRASRE